MSFNCCSCEVNNTFSHTHIERVAGDGNRGNAPLVPVTDRYKKNGWGSSFAEFTAAKAVSHNVSIIGYETQVLDAQGNLAYTEKYRSETHSLPVVGTLNKLMKIFCCCFPC